MKRLKVFSRHPSHALLRIAGLQFDKRTLIRLGSTTVPHRKYDVEINSIDAVNISSNKLLMKQKFTSAGVKTADWFRQSSINLESNFLFQSNFDIHKEFLSSELPYPIVAKHIFGSRGTGNYLLKSAEALEAWMKGRDLSNYIFEAFFKKGREYRLHVTKDGCFYTCRKLLRTGSEETWHRHAENCIWVVEENPKFDKPINWDVIVSDCVKALEAIGADVLAFDVKVQLSKNKEGKVRENPKYIIIESCSAPSFGAITLKKYVEEIPKIYNSKTIK